MNKLPQKMKVNQIWKWIESEVQHEYHKVLEVRNNGYVTLLQVYNTYDWDDKGDSIPWVYEYFEEDYFAGKWQFHGFHYPGQVIPQTLTEDENNIIEI